MPRKVFKSLDLPVGGPNFRLHTEKGSFDHIYIWLFNNCPREHWKKNVAAMCQLKNIGALKLLNSSIMVVHIELAAPDVH